MSVHVVSDGTLNFGNGEGSGRMRPDPEGCMGTGGGVARLRYVVAVSKCKRIVGLAEGTGRTKEAPVCQGKEVTKRRLGIQKQLGGIM